MSSTVAVPRRHSSTAMGLILLAMLAFALQDMVVRLVAEQVSIWQLQAVRLATVLVVIVAATALTGRLLMLSTAVSHLVGMLSSIRAYQSEEASRLAPFEYSYLAVIPLLDILGWGVVPETTTLAGMALIAVAGAFVAMREGRRARPTILPQSRPPTLRVRRQASARKNRRASLILRARTG